MSDKLKAIVCHIFIVGWLISLAFYLMGEKTPLTRFYLRQMLGLVVLSLIIGFFSGTFGMLLSIGLFAMWAYSLVGAIKEREQEIPVIGPYFQQWFTFV